MSVSLAHRPVSARTIPLMAPARKVRRPPPSSIYGDLRARSLMPHLPTAGALPALRSLFQITSLESDRALQSIPCRGPEAFCLRVPVGPSLSGFRLRQNPPYGRTGCPKGLRRESSVRSQLRVDREYESLFRASRTCSRRPCDRNRSRETCRKARLRLVRDLPAQTRSDLSGR